MPVPTDWYMLGSFTYTGSGGGWSVSSTSHFSGVPNEGTGGSSVVMPSVVAALMWMKPNLRPRDFWPPQGPIFNWTDEDMEAEIDAPFDPAGFELASDRLRAFLERQAPGHVDFLPVQMRGCGWEKLKQRYWVMHLQYHWDCVDEAESWWSDPDEDTGEREIMRGVYDPARIPTGQLLGLDKSTLLCHRSIKRAYEAEGLTGFDFLRSR